MYSDGTNNTTTLAVRLLRRVGVSLAVEGKSTDVRLAVEGKSTHENNLQAGKVPMPAAQTVLAHGATVTALLLYGTSPAALLLWHYSTSIGGADGSG